MQELDSRLDLLRHQAEHPPEAVELADQAALRARVDGRARNLQVQVDDLTREQRKADADVEQVKARRVRDQQRLDGGMVTNPKDLERLQHELVSLDRRITDLEDAELDVMERLEAVQTELTRLDAELATVDERVAALAAARDERVAGLRKEATEVVARREEAVAGLPAELVTLYEKLRQQKDGVGAAALRARRCGGCSLELDHSELAAIAKQPSDAVLRCEECSRILVRTHESGV